MRLSPPQSQPRDAPIALTVIIPAYNSSAFITDAIASAQAQLPPPAEVVVVDDCSDDDTVAVAERAGARVLCTEENGGPGEARALGVRAATTEWVAFLDADDTYLPGHLQRMWDRRGSHVLLSEAALAVPSGRWLGYAGIRSRVLKTPASVAIPQNLIVTSAAMARRATLLEIGGFSQGRHSEDLATWLELLERGSALVLPRLGVHYREHPAQTTASPEMVGSARTVMEQFVGRSWFQESLLRALDATSEWDRDRASLLTQPASWPSLVVLLGQRRCAAARQWKTAKASSHAA